MQKFPDYGQISATWIIYRRAKQGRNSQFCIWEGEKIRIFGQNIYPCPRLSGTGV
jgi:hypothetical protein